MANGFILIVAGLLLFYVVISDKFYCLVGCAACLSGKLDGTGASIGYGEPAKTLGTGGTGFLMPGEPLAGGPSGSLPTMGGMLGLP